MEKTIANTGEQKMDLSSLVFPRPIFCVPAFAMYFPQLDEYTGGILQQLDTDVHSAVTVKTSTALWQQWCEIVMLQRWQWQRWDISDYDMDVTAMFTSVWQQWQLTVLWQWYKNWQRCDSSGSWQHHDSDVYISVTVLSVATFFTVMCTSLSH